MSVVRLEVRGLEKTSEFEEGSSVVELTYTEEAEELVVEAGGRRDLESLLGRREAELREEDDEEARKTSRRDMSMMERGRNELN